MRIDLKIELGKIQHKISKIDDSLDKFLEKHCASEALTLESRPSAQPQLQLICRPSDASTGTLIEPDPNLSQSSMKEPQDVTEYRGHSGEMMVPLESGQSQEDDGPEEVVVDSEPRCVQDTHSSATSSPQAPPHSSDHSTQPPGSPTLTS